MLVLNLSVVAVTLAIQTVTHADLYSVDLEQYIHTYVYEIHFV